MSQDTKEKNKYLKEKRILLEGFGIEFSEEVRDNISNMYPRDVDVRKYTKKLILDHLGDD